MRPGQREQGALPSGAGLPARGDDVTAAPANRRARPERARASPPAGGAALRGRGDTGAGAAPGAEGRSWPPGQSGVAASNSRHRTSDVVIPDYRVFKSRPPLPS